MAADKGDTQSKCLLGIMYYEGVGVTKDKEKAYKLLREAADDGDEDAEKFLREDF